MSKPYWQGVFPAVTTQLKKDQSLDLDATARHIEALIKSGVSGLVMCGSLGENQALDLDEKRRVIACAMEAAQGRVPVLSGVPRPAPASRFVTRATWRDWALTASCCCLGCFTKVTRAKQ